MPKDPYIDEETGVLKNIPNIKNEQTLYEFETACSSLRNSQLKKFPIQGNFNLIHLQEIHKKLFGDVYHWASKIRTIDIIKENTRFCHNAFILKEMAKISDSLKKESFLVGLDNEKFSERAAYYMGEINAFHPFREGNGRTQRVFINQLANLNKNEINWKNISQEEMKIASINAFACDYNVLANLIKNNLSLLSADKRK